MTTKNAIRRVVPRTVRNWLRSPRTSAKWIGDEVSFALGVQRIVELGCGWSLRCHPAVCRVICQSQKEDPLQVAELEAFVASCRAEMVLFDIGAHFGIFSLAALHFGGPKARAIPVDPSPLACRIMKIQAAVNHCAGRLDPIQACVGDRVGWKEMLDIGVLSGGYYIAAPKEYLRKDRIRTRQITVDSLAEKLKLLPTHVKIDVEGSEADVLTGMRGVLRRASPLLFLELHNDIVRGQNANPSETLSLVRAFGYRMFTADGNSLGDAEILNSSLIRVVAQK